jgi:hypothetical protein
MEYQWIGRLCWNMRGQQKKTIFTSISRMVIQKEKGKIDSLLQGGRA